jgi:hypothetical protein
MVPLRYGRHRDPWRACKGTVTEDVGTLAPIVHNLTRTAGIVASRHASARGATIRRDLIDVAARTVPHRRGHLTVVRRD